jgi:signal peptidase I
MNRGWRPRGQNRFAVAPDLSRRMRCYLGRLVRRSPATPLLISAALFVAFVFPRAFATYRIDSSSMEPTLHCAAGPGCLRLRSDELLVSKLIYEFRSVHRGDIIVFHPPGRDSAGGRPILLVKRVIAVEGDEIEERRGRIFVDGHPLIERYIRPEYRDNRSFPSLRVPRGTCFVLGDNRKRSYDSREFGVIRRSAIVGKVIAVNSPLSRLTPL